MSGEDVALHISLRTLMLMGRCADISLLIDLLLALHPDVLHSALLCRSACSYHVFSFSTPNNPIHKLLPSVSYLGLPSPIMS